MILVACLEAGTKQIWGKVVRVIDRPMHLISWGKLAKAREGACLGPERLVERSPEKARVAMLRSNGHTLHYNEAAGSRHVPGQAAEL